ncbi:DUF1648 domain-containing protein [Streptomyces sp. I05A-00742]|uniref:DUF1648 domain-containing protein n=1 Tax=Streptomyces sp. I05A-00742 TaxID=2732853 RepID=UPI001488961F|nr:DUF1648 domain-containing protein [Streptomyces sp. I05A-00742]
MNLPVRTVGRPWRTVLIALPHLLGLGVFLAVFGGERHRLPDRMAVHFTGSGRADGFTSVGAFPYQALALVLVPAVVFAVLAPFLDLEPFGWRCFTGIAYAVAALVASLLTWTVLGNAAGDSPEDVRLRLDGLVAVLGVAAAAGGLGLLLAVLAPPARRTDVTAVASGPRLALGASEGAVWTRSVVSRPLLGVGAAMLVAGLAIGLTAGWGSGLVMLGVGGLLLALPGARVTVDRHGLTAVPLWTPRPRLRIGLDRVESADSRGISALREFGGWGYRARPGRSGLVLRSGDALVIRLTTGSEFVVTVDEAATAAALLNALVDRDRRRVREGG